MEEIQQIATWLRLFIEPGQVTELRALDVSDGNGRWTRTEAGYFDHDHLLDMAKAAHRLTQNAVGVYFVPNPIKPALLARAANKVKTAKEKNLTNDSHIIKRKWMLVDADPVRPSGISSTDEEKQLAWEVIRQVKEYMWALDWEDPCLADSGNGYHLLYPINLQTDDNGMVQKALANLANRFDTDHVTIDRDVFNPSRIIKLYGTLSAKGDHTTDRPHRQSRVIEYEYE